MNEEATDEMDGEETWDDEVPKGHYDRNQSMGYVESRKLFDYWMKWK